LSSRSFFHFANDSGVTGVSVPVRAWREVSRKSSRVRVLGGDFSRRAFSARRWVWVWSMNLLDVSLADYRHGRGQKSNR